MVVAAGAYVLALTGVAVIFAVLVGFRVLAPAVVRRVTAGQRLLRVEHDDDGPGRRAMRRVVIEVRPRHLSALERLVDVLAARPEVRLAASEVGARGGMGGGLLRLDLARRRRGHPGGIGPRRRPPRGADPFGGP